MMKFLKVQDMLFFGVAGQICTAMSRLVVHKSVKDEVVDKLVDLSKSLKIGPGIEKDTDLNSCNLRKSTSKS